MLSLAELVERQVRRAFIVSSCIAVAVLIGQTLLSVWETERTTRSLIIRHSAAIAQSAALAQDVMQVQREVSRLLESLDQSRGALVHVVVSLEGRKLAEGGFPVDTTSRPSIRSVSILGSGSALTIEVWTQAGNRLWEGVLQALLLTALSAVGFWMFHRTVRGSIGVLLGELQRAQVSQELAELAAQVSHDIRSPLAALLSVVRNSTHLEESARVSLRLAAHRIEAIANQLLTRNKEKTVHTPLEAEKILQELESCHLLLEVQLAVMQKRLQFADDVSLSIEEDYKDAYGLFAHVQKTELAQVLSNLLENAVESLENKSGRVQLRLFELAESQVCIEIRDTGKGIAPDILSKLGVRGGTYGKKKGSGLGLYHAKTTVESWSGQLHIESTPGQGTAVSLQLSKVPPPPEFVSQIEIPPQTTVLILDDDPSVHAVWDTRLAHRMSARSLMHFESPDAVRAWYRASFMQIENLLFLCDYELQGSTDTGLDLIESLGVGGQSILVTSRHDEPWVLERCARVNVRVLPKILAGVVPIKICEAPL